MDFEVDFTIWIFFYRYFAVTALIKNEMKSKYPDDPYSGPYEIVRVNRNGTLRYRKGAVTDVINIRNCTPYYD